MANDNLGAPADLPGDVEKKKKPKTMFIFFCQTGIFDKTTSRQTDLPEKVYFYVHKTGVEARCDIGRYLMFYTNGTDSHRMTK